MKKILFSVSLLCVVQAVAMDGCLKELTKDQKSSLQQRSQNNAKGIAESLANIHLSLAQSSADIERANEQYKKDEKAIFIQAVIDSAAEKGEEIDEDEAQLRLQKGKKKTQLIREENKAYIAQRNKINRQKIDLVRSFNEQFKELSKQQTQIIRSFSKSVRGKNKEELTLLKKQKDEDLAVVKEQIKIFRENRQAKIKEGRAGIDAQLQQLKKEHEEKLALIRGDK